MENKGSKAVAGRSISLVSSKKFAAELFEIFDFGKIIKSSGTKKKSLNGGRCGCWAATSKGIKPPTPLGKYLTGSPWPARSCGYGGHRKGIGRLLHRTVHRRRAVL
jgi:hypothetical protein